MMFTRADIRRVSIAVRKADYRKLVVMLGKCGLMQIDGSMAGEYVSEENISAVADLRVNTGAAECIISYADEFLSSTGYTDDPASGYDSILDDFRSLFSRDCMEDLGAAEYVKQKPEQYMKLRSMIENEIKRAESGLGEIRLLKAAGFDLYAMKGMKFLTYLYGKIENSSPLNDAKGKWFYCIYGNRIVCIFPPDEKNRLLDIFKECGITDTTVPAECSDSIEEAERSVECRLSDLKRRMERLDLCYRDKINLWYEKMACLKKIYSIIIKFAGAEASINFSHDLALINGWIDMRDADLLSGLIHDTCGDRFFIRIASRMEGRKFRERIPVRLRNGILFRPFELLVKMMGIPGNSEVDPTPAAALTYVTLFGVMFGDAGQGLVIAAVGYVLSVYGRRKHGGRNRMSDFGMIMIWCGFSAVIFGFLYGSVFSNEHLMPALLFHPMENMMRLFFIAIMMGSVFISSGLLLNVINGAIAGNYGESFFGTKGVAGLAVYVFSIYFVMRYILKGVLPSGTELAVSVFLPAVLFSARGPLKYIFFHGEEVFPHGLFEYIVESVIEIIEMLSGFLANTVSFIRAGAFALSHAGLSIAVYTLAAIVDPSMKGSGAAMVIVFGNIFIILLEGLVCSIQSMRLEFYEFFGKFYKGDGAGFVPFSLRFNR